MAQIALGTMHRLSVALRPIKIEHTPKMTKFNWQQLIEGQGITAEEYLLKHYSTMEIKDIAKALKCHRNVIMRRAKKLKLGSRHAFKKDAGSHYKNDEKKLIEQVKAGKCNKCIAKDLNRTSEAIRKKVERLVSQNKIESSVKASRCKGTRSLCELCA